MYVRTFQYCYNYLLMSKEHRIHLHIVFMKEDGGWVAQALQHDFAAQGNTQETALRALAHTIASHFMMADKIGLSDPLADVQPAPNQYWELFETAAKREMRAAELDAPGLPPAFAIQAFADSDGFCPAY
jgi:hypothetical protein